MTRALGIGAVVWVLATPGCKAPAEVLRGPEEVPAPGPVRLAFKPVAGRTLVERTRTVRTGRATAPGEGGAQPSRESVEAVLATRFEPGQGGRWILTQQVTSVSVEVDGKPIANPLVDLVTRFPVKLEIAADGTFVRYLNPEAAEAAVRALFREPGQAEAVLSYFSPRALEVQARREWESKYGGLFERHLVPGTSFYAVETAVLPGGEELAYGVERKVLGPVSTAHGSGVALGIQCLGQTDGPGKEILERLMEERELASLEPSVRCEGRQEVVGEPFVPVRTILRLTARPDASSGAGPVEITLDKTTATERIE